MYSIADIFIVWMRRDVYVTSHHITYYYDRVYNNNFTVNTWYVLFVCSSEMCTWTGFNGCVSYAECQ